MTIERPMFPRHNEAKPQTLRGSYMDLEPQIIDLDRAGRIAFILADRASGGEAEEIELLYFAVDQFGRMAADLKKAYADGFAQIKGEE
jgi:hypothetical protein